MSEAAAFRAHSVMTDLRAGSRPHDRTRPGYPTALFTDLAGLAAIGPASRVAEIGPGTGQATTALLDGGAHVVTVEPSRPTCWPPTPTTAP
jgi:protein-L-isoaspartate O-methyltransferase